MTPTCNRMADNAAKALGDESLQRALGRTAQGFPVKRLAAIARLPEFEALRDQAVEIKNHTLDNLDFYLERFEAEVTRRGGTVHWCVDADEARAAILGICKAAGARTVTKGKSMIGEEIAINEHLEASGITPIETDLGEYIIQLRGEPPSHIIAPAIHVSKEQVADAFRGAHVHLDPERSLEAPQSLLDEARAILRQKFLAADVGITGANFLIAETGSTVIVTNEGNGDLTQILPKTHIVVASIEKVVPTLEDATAILRVLARSITGQEQSVYTTFSTGPRRADDPDGPERFHVVLLDNGRSALLGTPARDILRCIRCGACLMHCPVYTAIGGHAYGWCYSGPMGAALTPGLLGPSEALHHPHASTLCGKCQDVCPMRIPIPDILRHWRDGQFAAGLMKPSHRRRLALWRFMVARPALWQWWAGLKVRGLAMLAGRKGRFSWLPMAGAWTRTRDLPAPEGRTFQNLWDERGGAR